MGFRAGLAMLTTLFMGKSLVVSCLNMALILSLINVSLWVMASGSPRTKRRRHLSVNSMGWCRLPQQRLHMPSHRCCNHLPYLCLSFESFVQARFALSSCEEWGAEDGNFILEAFYKVIMELFEDEEDQWVIDTLDWWNKCIMTPFFFLSEGEHDI